MIEEILVAMLPLMLMGLETRQQTKNSLLRQPHQ